MFSEGAWAWATGNFSRVPEVSRVLQALELGLVAPRCSFLLLGEDMGSSCLLKKNGEEKSSCVHIRSRRHRRRVALPPPPPAGQIGALHCGFGWMTQAAAHARRMSGSYAR